MARKRPLCKRCEQRHWYFVACEKAADAAKREDTNRARREQQAQVVFLHRTADGGVTAARPGNAWGPDRLATVTRIGGNTFVQAPKDAA